MFQASFLLVLPLSILLGGVAEKSRPVAQVVTLLTDLKDQVEKEGRDEAKTYDTFACFCRTQTTGKSTAITSGRDAIGTHSTDIEQKTASREELKSEIADRQANHEQMVAEKVDTETRLAAAREAYATKNADLEKAISSLNKAIQAMTSSKPVFLAVRNSVEQSLALAEALNLIADSKRAEVSSFLQKNSVAVDPSDPGYKYHSQGIIDTLEQLLQEFKEEKTEHDTEWGKTRQTLQETIQAYTEKIEINEVAILGITTEIDDLAGEIATARQSLVVAESVLKDDQLYLKDLTTRCETRAKEWDQRSALRAGELTALAAALKILTDEVQGRDTSVNNRTFLIERGVAPVSAHRPVAIAAKISQHVASPSFLQEDMSELSNLRGAHTAVRSSKAKKEEALSLLRDASRRLRSTVLSSVAAHIDADPFASVKVLVQKLIERLVKEATAEATKKGFCDEQLGMARESRDNRFAETKKLSLEMQGLELKEDELVSSIQLLTQALQTLRSDLDDATDNRKAERLDNQKTIKTAQEGLKAVQEAILILEVFYKNAGKATVLLQASPVDEDNVTAGYSGVYRGRQEESKGIIATLKVIESDFDRTARLTQAAEEKAQAEFVEFDRASKADISGKDTKKTLDSEDLEATRNLYQQKKGDLQAAQKILDDALKAIESLKPMCIDTGMSYQDRVAKREEEIAALCKALTILDVDGVEGAQSACTQR